MSKEEKREVVSAKTQDENGNSVTVYYTGGKGKGYSANIDEAKVFKNGGSFFNSLGSAVYRMKESYRLLNIGIDKL